MLIYHVHDQVIGHEAALHTVLQAQPGGLEGTAVVQLRGDPEDAHNEDPASFSPREWREALGWMQDQLELQPTAQVTRPAVRRSAA